MQKQTIHSYVWFGTCVRYLQDAVVGALIREPIEGGGHVLYNLDSFFDWLTAMNLQVTLRASGDLRRVRDDLAAASQGATLDGEQVTRLTTAISALRKTLEAELAGS